MNTNAAPKETSGPRGSARWACAVTAAVRFIGGALFLGMMLVIVLLLALALCARLEELKPSQHPNPTPTQTHEH